VARASQTYLHGMPTYLPHLVAQEHRRDLERQAEAARVARSLRERRPSESPEHRHVTVSFSALRGALRRVVAFSR